MKKPLFYGSIAVAIIIVVVVSLKFFSPSSYNLAISVPSPAGTSSGSSSSDGKQRLEVTPDTVQAVLKTLVRADSFSRTYTIKSYWTGGESDSTLKMWQKAKNIRLNISQNNTVKNILVRGTELYIWYDGVSGVFTSELSDDKVNSEVDKFSRLVTYEDIYDSAAENITKAAYETEPVTGQACIFAEYKSEDGNYVNQIYVSIDSGLLVSTNIHENNVLVYSMESSSPELSTPADDIFTPPST